MDYQRLLIDHLDLINQIVRTTGRRRHLSATEREDFAGFVHVRLIDDNYAILRKFKGRSSMKTYLSAVIERLSLDFCAEEWGRWRPSAMAERLGPVAVLLERLVTRDSHSIEEAIEIVRTHHDVTQSDSDLRRIWEQLPVRVRTTEVGEDAAVTVSSNENSEVKVDDEERRKSIAKLQAVLQTSFARLAAQDRVLIALSFDQDMSIAEISPLLNKSIPTLHRRLNNSLEQLAQLLRQSGLDPDEILQLIGHPSIALSPLLRAEVERFFRHVRLFKRDG